MAAARVLTPYLPPVPASVVDAAEVYIEAGFQIVALWGLTPAGACQCPAGVDCGKAAGKHPVMRGWQHRENVDVLAHLRRQGRLWAAHITASPGRVVTVVARGVDPGTLQLSEVPLRLRRVHDTVPAGPVRAHAALEELLPLDDARLAEARVWLAALGRCRIDPTLDDLRLTGWQGERYLARAAICDLVGTSWPTRPDAPLPEPLEAEAEALHVVVDGLTMMGASYPERLGPADTRRLLGAALSHARARLTAHVPDSPSVAAGRHPDPS